MANNGLLYRTPVDLHLQFTLKPTVQTRLFLNTWDQSCCLQNVLLGSEAIIHAEVVGLKRRVLQGGRGGRPFL